MPMIDPNEIELVEKPELIFGIVAAVGTPLGHVKNALEVEQRARDYSLEEIRLSVFLKDSLNLNSELPADNASEFDRIMSLMDRGNELRERFGGGQALALFSIALINSKRDPEHPFLSGKSFLLNQLKHPEEVHWLRKVYGPAFHLIGTYCSEYERINNLTQFSNMTEEQARCLINRDTGENDPLGQQLRDTFYLSDIFIKTDRDDGTGELLKKQMKRYFQLLFTEGIITPTKDEYGMQIAYSASLRSADLSRQVGAAIFNKDREVISVGCNDVPAPGGGQYWDDNHCDARDFILGFDSNYLMKCDMLKEIIPYFVDSYHTSNEEEQESLINQKLFELRETRLMNITEFGRSVHAEMEALLSASRKGVSLVGGTLYATTFPCHNCAKHIIGVGIRRVIYIEPYPKSLAKELHGDAIRLAEEREENGVNNKIVFEPFVGVAPRMYWSLFSMQSPYGTRYRRKNATGQFNDISQGLKVSVSPLSYIERESIAALAIKRFEKIDEEDEINE